MAINPISIIQSLPDCLVIKYLAPSFHLEDVPAGQETLVSWGSEDVEGLRPRCIISFSKHYRTKTTAKHKYHNIKTCCAPTWDTCSAWQTFSYLPFMPQSYPITNYFMPLQVFLFLLCYHCSLN